MRTQDSTFLSGIYKSCLCFATAACVLMLQPARAQTLIDAGQTPTPPEAQLNQPGAQIQPTQQVAQPTTGIPQQAPQGQAAATPQADLCPNASQALAEPVNDMVQVQSDIERLSLCAQRAQLLERLNESAETEKESIKSALGLSIPPELKEAAEAKKRGEENPALMMPQGLQPLPADVLAGADVSAAPSKAEAEETARATEPEKPKSWQIKEVFGPTDKMQARILSPEGNEAVVRRGSRLKGGFLVTGITATSVTISKGKTAETLEWATN